MPIININASEGYIIEEIKPKLIKYLSQAMLSCEGLKNTKKTRSLTWCFFNEIKKESWMVGGENCFENKALIKVSMFKNILNKNKKDEIAESVQNIFKNCLKSKYDPDRTWVIIDEIEDDNFCSNGKTVSSSFLSDLMIN
jgi:phenylpyruvate tautomerase PptA (4-oxalocrotonate tautomerase family)